MNLHRVAPRLSRPFSIVHRVGSRPLSDFAALELTNWQRGAGAYEALFGPVTMQAVNPLLDAAGVRRTVESAVALVEGTAPPSVASTLAACLVSLALRSPPRCGTGRTCAEIVSPVSVL